MARIIIPFLFFISNISLSTACDKPALLNAESITTSSALITWTGFDENIESYQIDLQESNKPPSDFPLYNDYVETELLLEGLNPGTLYSVWIRSQCSEGKSDWVKLPVRTAFNNNQNCEISFLIQDNNCAFQGHEKLKISIDSTDIAGYINPQLSSISFIIEHGWPADLKAKLISPSGVEIDLFENLSLGYPDIGDPSDKTCTQTMTLSDNSCTNIQSSTGPFIGDYQPIDELQSVREDDMVGYWILDICDNALGDVGELVYFKMNFSSGTCKPVRHELKSYDNTSAEFGLSDVLSNDTIIYKYGISPLLADDSTGFILDTFPIHYAGDTTVRLSGLQVGKDYTFYALRKCDGDSSSYTCSIEITTSCSDPTYISDFNNYPVYESYCTDSSLTDGMWYQDDETLYRWRVASGPSKTEHTGPEGSPFGDNPYLYFDASDFSCGAIPAVLKSSCIYVPNNIRDCSMAFDYMMYGTDVNSLTLRLIVNESESWDTLFHLSGDQGDKWFNTIIDLTAYRGQAINMEFIAGPAISARGDIAIDNIILLGPVPIHRDGYIMYRDRDGDNYGVTADSTRFCRKDMVPGYSLMDGDCDDDNPHINPGAAEIPCNLIDDNCNGLVDEVLPDSVPIIRLVHKSNPSCRGLFDGSLEISIEDYSGYTIKWNTGDTTSRLDSLSSGVYYAEIEADDGCLFRSQYFELKNSSNINALVTSVKNATCNNSYDGSITVQAGGGSTPYQFLWNTGSTTATLDSIASGIYSVTVTDDEGCMTIIDSINLLSEYDNRTKIDVITPIKCSEDSSGSIIASLQGAQVQSYVWNTGDSTRIIRNLSEGVYICTMTFMDGCTISTDSFFFKAPDPLYLKKLKLLSPTCSDEDDGLILTQMGGGTPPYHYRLYTEDSYITGPIFEDLASGMYKLEVRDNNNCAFSLDSIILEERTQLNLNPTITDTRCPLSGDGAIEVDVTGGTEPYTFVWSNVGIGTKKIDNLYPGNYHLNIVDNLGCKSERYRYTVKRGKDSLDVQLHIIDSLYCGDSVGVLNATVLNSSDFPIEYNWSSGKVHNHSQPIDSLTQALSGTYNVTVTDANGCVGVSEKIDLIERDTLAYDNIIVNQLTCENDSSGSIEITMTHYHPPLSFNWNIDQDSAIVKNLSTGTYQATITDGMDCKVTTPAIEIFKDNPLKVEHNATRIKDNLYEIEVKPTGGESPYSIVWQGDTTTSFIRTNLEEGEYFYTVFDFLGCSIDSSIVTNENTVDLINMESTNFTILPNPAQTSFSIELPHKLNTHSFTLSIYNTQGVLVKEVDTLSDIDIYALPPGTYHLELNSDKLKLTGKLLKL